MSTVLGDFKLEDVLPYVGNSPKKRKYKAGKEEYLVRMNSPRYYVFKAMKNCVSCGIEGCVMRLEKHHNDKMPHFNLYAKNESGDLVLMTKDHVVPKNRGGDNHHSNYQTMCSVCNSLKGDMPLKIEHVSKLREIYNQHVNKVSKKSLRKMIYQYKQDIGQCFEFDDSDLDSNSIRLAFDIYVYLTNDGSLLVAYVYQAKVEESIHVACIGKGTKLTPSKIDDDGIYIPFNDRLLYIYNGMLAE